MIYEACQEQICLICFALFPAIDDRHYDMDTVLILKQTIFPYFPSAWSTEVNRKAFIDFNGISIKP